MSLEKRLNRLEDYCPKQRQIEEMTSDELAQLITGNPDAKAADLSDADLEAIAGGES